MRMEGRWRTIMKLLRDKDKKVYLSYKVIWLLTIKLITIKEGIRIIVLMFKVTHWRIRISQILVCIKEMKAVRWILEGSIK
jgi:hypothetical protein